MAIPVVVTYPVASGTPIIGQTLSVTTGTWDVTPDSFTYQWYRDGSLIGSATNPTYVLVTADLNRDVLCAVVAVNVDGNSLPAASNAIGPIREPAPVNLSPAVVTGDPNIGNVLSCSPGGWSNNPTSFTYSWRDPQPITDAVGPTLDVTPDLIGKSIACLVTAHNASGQAMNLSNWVGPVAYRPLTPAEQFSLFLARYSYPRPGSPWTG